jgi:uncharacterized phage protein (TIGR02216 family)
MSNAGYSDGLPWHSLLEVAFTGFGLSPQQFWSMTPGEWSLISRRRRDQGHENVCRVTRGELQDLMQRFPDVLLGGKIVG